MKKQQLNIIKHSLMYARYFAPCGKGRLLMLGEQISNHHLDFNDKLIGIIGDAGSGKSIITKGMFPGLELVNNDSGLTSGKIMQMRLNFNQQDFDSTTYHLDIRFQMAFTQMYEICEFVKGALTRGRRLVIEHFDLLYPHLKTNADLLVGIGEEIIVTRPTLFGPLPEEIHNLVFPSLIYRKKLHTAEDLTHYIIERDYNLHDFYYGDIRRGFVLTFNENPDLDLYDLENKVKQLIDQNLPVNYVDEGHIMTGDHLIECTGPRIHVRTTGEIESFALIKEPLYDRINDVYFVVGRIISDDTELKNINKIRFS